MQYLEDRQAQEELTAFRAHRRRSVVECVSQWLGTSAFLVFINLFTLGGHWTEIDHYWVLWPAGIYGFFVLKEVLEKTVFGRFTEAAAFQKWRDAKAAKASSAGTETDIESLVLRERMGKLEAIARVREATGLSLNDAKEAVDAIARRHPGVFS